MLRVAKKDSRRLLSSSSAAAIEDLPLQFLRASDPANFDKDTFQRKDVVFDKLNGKPLITSTPKTPLMREYTLHGESYKVVWEDGVVSEYQKSWVKKQLDLWGKSGIQRVMWNNLTEGRVRNSKDLSMGFEEALTSDGQAKALKALYQYGILLVTNTPIDDRCSGSVAALASALGGGAKKDGTSVLNKYLNGQNDDRFEGVVDGPLRTLYGTVWSTSTSDQSAGASTADSAYGNESLPLHTDMTYIRDPPGLQIFTMVRPATTGGESLFGDGFAAAEKLRSVDPMSFRVLSELPRRYRCVDLVSGWHLEASGPVISLNYGRVVGVRHNDLDRLPDLPPERVENVDEFYETVNRAHRSWDEILASDDIRLTLRLQAGETAIVANQRCFHGRLGFRLDGYSSRVIKGCYVSQDEFESRLRWEGYHV
ncbi:trimethyllysine dioxygenase [Fistulifera solaris]|uniref:Trimethyllysine dioxygenase n=1 Tax=Fistulifera solaris TaxID=1519565 RepID=A0A1Z5KDM4_FISSO|nr:trimethyllysine dioxygenase [Fistulifera solaris]|eukprot:GAX24400.1 trimethyllysine dioxygenase [Fistulifera solaris]